MTERKRGILCGDTLHFTFTEKNRLVERDIIVDEGLIYNAALSLARKSALHLLNSHHEERVEEIDPLSTLVPCRYCGRLPGIIYPTRDSDFSIQLLCVDPDDQGKTLVGGASGKTIQEIVDIWNSMNEKIAAPVTARTDPFEQTRECIKCHTPATVSNDSNVVTIACQTKGCQETVGMRPIEKAIDEWNFFNDPDAEHNKPALNRCGTCGASPLVNRAIGTIYINCSGCKKTLISTKPPEAAIDEWNTMNPVAADKRAFFMPTVESCSECGADPLMTREAAQFLVRCVVCFTAPVWGVSNLDAAEKWNAKHLLPPLVGCPACKKVPMTAMLPDSTVTQKIWCDNLMCPVEVSVTGTRMEARLRWNRMEQR